ncbi:hypothetical protein [Frankia sp. CiP3]|uniref:hypothetical protein n=1 Tax=Frankia sp. CiP3 TaxID=2880971 RepID=UPI001EF6ABD3|nr:hypothetical protein [Frankia sp. CiP3]
MSSHISGTGYLPADRRDARANEYAAGPHRNAQADPGGVSRLGGLVATISSLEALTMGSSGGTP